MAQTQAFITEQFAQLVTETVPIPTHGVCVQVESPPILSLTNPNVSVHQDKVAINIRQVELSQSVIPGFNQIPLRYPIQTGREVPGFTSPFAQTFKSLAVAVRAQPLLSFPLNKPSVVEAAHRIRNVLFSWKPMTLAQFPQKERCWLNEALQQRVSTQRYEIQAIFYPIHVNRFHKLLRHPSGKLLGIPKKCSESENATNNPLTKASVPCAIAWLTISNKPRMESIPLEGQLW